jgi:hypothetical protein
LTVNDKQTFQGARVVAKLGELTGDARIRVAAKLPILPDFSKVPAGRPPSGWVNAGGKFVVEELKDGTKVLKKTATNSNAQVVMAYTYFGASTLTDYTIEADVKGVKVGENMPDAGIVAGRYEMKLMGNEKILKVLTWEAIPRLDETVKFTWKPDTWYTMKLTFEVKDGKATVRGKVWPRGNDEPKNWDITLVDETPNLEGSPALYGYAAGTTESKPGSELYFDKVRVTPNKKN